jgi:dihydropteroate synthase
VNVTPDSFSDGGVFFNVDKAVAHGVRMAEEGADFVDVGGESSRPFSEPVPADEELGRVIPVIEGLAKRISIPISIDTMKSEVAARALDAGASVINDVSALRRDPAMAPLAGERKAPLIVMHMKGMPRDMQVSPEYDDLIGEIQSFFRKTIETARFHSIPNDRLIIDPGIGFGKTVSHNLELIGRLEEFSVFDVPVLIGPSRKHFIRNILKKKEEKDIRADLPIVETGTQAAVCASVLRGAHIVRVHNVANTVATIKIVDAIVNVNG